MANEAHAITINGIPISLGVTEVATQDKNGLMSAADKKKLDDLADGSNNSIDVDTTLSSTSTNPVQNKTIKQALDNKVDKVSGKGLSTNDFTTDLKNKLEGLSDTPEVTEEMISDLGFAKSSDNNFFVIPDSAITLKTDTTTGSESWENSNYRRSYITINENAGIVWKEGAYYVFRISNNIVPSKYRNGYIRIGENDTWHPITSAAFGHYSSYSVFRKDFLSLLQFKTTYHETGALHVVPDNDSHYTNTAGTGISVSGTGGVNISISEEYQTKINNGVTAYDKVNEYEVKTATSLPSTLVDNTIYNIGSKTGTLSIPTAPTSVKGIRINFTVTGGAFAITFADTPKWMDEAPELALENGNYTICILDGIYSLNKLV